MTININNDLSNLLKFKNELAKINAYIEVGEDDCLGNFIKCSRGVKETDLLLPTFSVLFASNHCVLCSLDYDKWLIPSLDVAIEFSITVLRDGPPKVRPPKNLINQYSLVHLGDDEFGNLFHSQIIGRTMLQLWGLYRQEIDVKGIGTKLTDLNSDWEYERENICYLIPSYFFSIDWDGADWYINAKSDEDPRSYSIDREGFMRCHIGTHSAKDELGLS